MSDRPTLLHDQTRDTSTLDRGKRCISVGHEDLLVETEPRQLHSRPEVLITPGNDYSESSHINQRPRAVQLAGRLAVLCGFSSGGLVSTVPVFWVRLVPKRRPCLWITLDNYWLTVARKGAYMPPWVRSAVDVLQLLVNVGALVGGAIIWKLYVGNLKAALTSKDAEISSVEKNRDMWRDQAQELEKRSPEVMELLLSERIQIRESEIARLAEDKGSHEEALKNLQREKANLETDL